MNWWLLRRIVDDVMGGLFFIVGCALIHYHTDQVTCYILLVIYFAVRKQEYKA